MPSRRLAPLVQRSFCGRVSAFRRSAFPRTTSPTRSGSTRWERGFGTASEPSSRRRGRWCRTRSECREAAGPETVPVREAHVSGTCRKWGFVPAASAPATHQMTVFCAYGAANPVGFAWQARTVKRCGARRGCFEPVFRRTGATQCGELGTRYVGKRSAASLPSRHDNNQRWRTRGGSVHREPLPSCLLQLGGVANPAHLCRAVNGWRRPGRPAALHGAQLPN